jgi:TolB-like protein/predicted TPR repeat methyltransferase
LSLFNELKRRNVIRVAIAYVIVAWLVMQVADVVLNNITAPGWVFHVILLMLAIGFIIVVVFSWVFEMTPEGLKRESEVDRGHSITAHTGKKLDRLITGVLVLALAYFVIDKFVLSGQRESAAVEAALEAAALERSDEPAEPRAGPSQEPDSSIAVLPFADMSPEGDQEYFSDGLSEELLNLLAKIPELRVAARTSAFSYKGKDIKIAQVGQELGVAHVLEGSVRTSGNRIRVTAQLIKSDDGFHLWSQTYDRTLDDVFAIQDEIAGAVVDALKVTLLGEAPHASETNPEAYALYLQARHLSNQLSEDNFAKAVDLFKQVLEIDPEYAPAWAGLSRNYRNMTVTGQLDEGEGLRMARQAIHEALRFDPDLAEAHARLGLMVLEVDIDPVTAAQHYRRAAELNPNDPAALKGLADLASFLDDHETAIEMSERAVRRDPVDGLGHLTLADAYYRAGRLAEALSSYQKALTLNSDLYAGWYKTGMTHLLRGDFEEALAAFEQEDDEEYQLKGRALCAHGRGDMERFERLFRQLRDEFGQRWPSEIAHVYAWTGDKDAAFEWLGKALAIKEGGLTVSRRIRLLEPLHGDPRWQEYLAIVGISDAQLEDVRKKIGLLD